MATVHKQVRPRPRLEAKPDPKADVRAAGTDVTQRFAKTLEYLAR